MNFCPSPSINRSEEFELLEFNAIDIEMEVAVVGSKEDGK